DRLTDAPDEKQAEILAAVRGLRDFKAYLQQNCTFDTFADENDLAAKVATTLANHARVTPASEARPARVWRPLVCYPLQPAPHFRGREALRADLLAWARSAASPDRVTSLVAMGGTGKTALAERVMYDLGDRPPAGLLCWS